MDGRREPLSGCCVELLLKEVEFEEMSFDELNEDGFDVLVLLQLFPMVLVIARTKTPVICVKVRRDSAARVPQIKEA